MVLISCYLRLALQPLLNLNHRILIQTYLTNSSDRILRDSQTSHRILINQVSMAAFLSASSCSRLLQNKLLNPECVTFPTLGSKHSYNLP